MSYKLGKGSFAANRDKLNKVEMRYIINANKFSCLRVNLNVLNILIALAIAISILNK